MSLEGLQLGRYRLLHLVGSGNMGEVYLAEDTQLNRQVAIKVTRTEAASYPDATATKEATRLFIREAKAIAALDHPHILPLFDYGEQIVNGATLVYMVMPFRKDGSFADWLQQRNKSDLLSFRQVEHFIGQAAGALQHAHDHQITHQDVKPSNFLIRSNNQNPGLPDLQLADFGIAKFIRATANTSLTIRGTPAYMAPEQWSGNPTSASDQYALAVMAYDFLTGRLPFQGGLEQMMYQHFQVQPQPPSQINPKLSPSVDNVLLLALAKAPAARFANISAFSRALRQVLLGGFNDAEIADTASTFMRTSPPLTSGSSGTRTPPSTGSSDIHTTLAISTAEAQRGTSRTLTFPDGRQVRVTVPAGVYDGQILRLEGLGQPSPYGPTGALLLSIAVAQAEAQELRADVANAANLATVTASRPSLTPTTLAVPYPSHETAGGHRSFPKGMTILLIILALIVGVGGGGLLYSYFTRTNSLPPTQVPGATNSQTHVTPTTPTNTNATAQANVTATAQANNATATASLSQNPYTHTGTLVLNDPLSDNSKGYNWQTGTNSNGATCDFIGGAYHVTQPRSGFFHSCTANNTDFSNFVFEVQMNMISGDYAGIIFCKPTPDTYYLFRIYTNGNYSLLRSVDANFDADAVPLANGTVASNQTNLIAVVVDNGMISLYLNRQFLKSVNDGTLTHGQIAVFTGNDTNSAETMFQNAKVWAL